VLLNKGTALDRSSLLIWRFFRRKSTTTETVLNKTGEEQLESKGVDAPRLSTFSFQAQQPQTEEDQPTLMETGDTAVEATAVEEPKANVADLVREKVSHDRKFSAINRGVSPAFIPSIREISTCVRIEAETLSFAEPRSAVTAWQAYLTLHPRDADAWFSYGQCSVVLDEDDDAIRAFSTALRIQGDYGLAHGALGFVLARQGAIQDAIAQYQRAIECRPTCVDMMSELARLYERAGASAEADALWVNVEILSNERVRS